MKEKLNFIHPESRAEWLALRKQSIGGSDAAAIVGLNPYVSPYALWVEKTSDEVKDEEVSEAIIQGTDLEDYVARRFSEKTGKKVRKRTPTIKNPKYPFAHANVDRWIVGENAGLECKTTNTLNYKKFKDGEFPANYYLQCLHYMAVTGADKYYLAVLVFGKDFIVHEFERDEETIQELMKAEANFWEMVETKTPPPVDGSQSTTKAINTLYDDPEDTSIDLFGMDSDIQKLQDLKEKKGDIEKEIARIEQEIKDKLGNNIKGESDRFIITWKPQKRKMFQKKEFEKANPDLDLSPYYKESESRVLRVKAL